MKDLIEESLSAFNNQYRISEILANICYEMSLKQKTKNFVDIKGDFKDCTIKGVFLELVYNKYTNYFAQFSNIDSDGNVYLKVYFPYSDILNKEKEVVIRKIKNCVSHELMHGNIFLNRLNNKKDLNDFYIDYEKWSMIRQNEDENTILYKFAYAIYATYYQEVQAFVSQATTQFEVLYNKNDLTNNEIRNGLKRCESYQIYSNILNNTIPLFEKLLNEDKIDYLLIPLKDKYDIDVDEEFVKKSLIKFKNSSEKALRNILRNIMLIANGVGENLNELKEVIRLKFGF